MINNKLTTTAILSVIWHGGEPGNYQHYTYILVTYILVTYRQCMQNTQWVTILAVYLLIQGSSIEALHVTSQI